MSLSLSLSLSMEEEEGGGEDISKSSLFYSDQLLCCADILLPSLVRARIEAAVLKFLKILTSPSPAVVRLSLSSLALTKEGQLELQINRTSNNCHVRHRLLDDVSSIFLSRSFCARSFMRAQDTKAFTRVWKVMELCSQILVQEKQVTQRELFYKLLCDSPDYFPNQKLLNKTVQDVVSLLCCSRQSLGIMASGRGAIAGRLLLKEPNQEVMDCSLLGSSGYAIPGDLNLLNKLVIQSDARYIIILEKDAIFQRLTEDRIFDQLPSILITAKGYPDIATRLLLHRLSMELPELPILALVDWNPSGLAILCTYKFGSLNMGLEAYRYACNVKWLGLRWGDLQFVDQHVNTCLKSRDLQIAQSLLSSKMLQDAYRTELNGMVERGQRVEIEALYSHGYSYLAKHIVKKIVQADYI